jgi:DHA2 family methylenomycin A resistance protein-like MFS transporter
MALTCIGSFMVMLDVSIVNTALPSIQRALGASFSQLQWVLDAYTLPFAVLLLPSGAVADRFGRKRIFQAGLVIFTLGSLFCGLAQGPGQLDAARVLQGIGGAALAPSSLALLATAFPEPQQRIHAVSMWAAMSAVGLGLGPTLGGALVEWAGWRWVFFLNVPVGIVCLILGARTLLEARDPAARRIDVPGLITSVLWLGAITYGFIEHGSLPWSSPSVYLPLIAAAVVLAVFVLVEQRSKEPMLPLTLFRSRLFSVTALVTFLLGAVLIVTPFLTAQYLQNVRHFSAFAAGLRMLAFSAMFSVLAPVAGRLARHLGFRIPITSGALISAVGFVFLSRISTDTSYVELAWRLVLVGAGFGLMLSPLASAALAGVDHRRSGLGSSIANSTRQIGVVVGVAVIGALVQTRAAHDALTALTAAHVPHADQLAIAVARNGAQSPAHLHGVSADLLADVGTQSYVGGLHLAFGTAAGMMLATGVLAALALGDTPQPEA